MGPEGIREYLQPSISPASRRKVLDLKFRILHGLYLPEHYRAPCNHCGSEDTIDHRFRDCIVAREARATLTRLVPETAQLDLRDLLLATPSHPHRAISEAFAWFIHCKALFRIGLLPESPTSLDRLVTEFSDTRPGL